MKKVLAMAQNIIMNQKVTELVKLFTSKGMFLINTWDWYIGKNATNERYIWLLKSLKKYRQKI